LRESAERALRESEETYELSFEGAPVGIGHAGGEGRWTRVNLRLREILGYRAQDGLVGRSVVEIAENHDAGRLAQALSELRAGRICGYTGEHRLATTRSAPVWGHVTLSALRCHSDRLERIIVVVEDISNQKQIELERSRLVSELSRAVRARDD